MARERKKKLPSGGAKLKAAGKHAVLLGIPLDDYASIAMAAMIDRRPVAQFIMFHAANAAKDVVEEYNRRMHYKHLQEQRDGATPAIEP